MKFLLHFLFDLAALAGMIYSATHGCNWTAFACFFLACCSGSWYRGSLTTGALTTDSTKPPTDV